MKKYFNKETKTEAIEGIHFKGTPPKHIILLDENSDFLKLEEQKFIFDENANGTLIDTSITEEQRLKNNKEEALAYQSDQQSQNELGILHGYSVEDLETRPVAKAQIDWMTSLFALKNLKDSDSNNDTPYSSVGDKPHSFEEIYAEKWEL